MKYLVTVKTDVYDVDCGVQVAGIFDTEKQANIAKTKVEDWLKKEEFEEFDVMVSKQKVNHLAWYEIEEDI